MNDPIIIAIDPGSLSLGYFIVEPSGLTQTGFVRLKPKDALPVRLSEIRRFMINVFTSLRTKFPHDDQPSGFLLIEGGISNRQAFSSAAVVDYVRGVIAEVTATWFGTLQVRFIAPASWRSIAGLKKGEKPTLESLDKLSGLIIKRGDIYAQDQIDAAWIAEYGRRNIARLESEAKPKNGGRKKARKREEITVSPEATAR